MTDQATELNLEVSRVIAAPREKLFDAWLDPEKLTRFMTPAQNMHVSTARSDARVGGRFLVMMVADGKDLPHEGTYKVIDRPNRLAFTWESPHSRAEESTVTIDFLEVPGGTNVRLRQVRFVSEASRDGHVGGWTAIIEALANAV